MSANIYNGGIIGANPVLTTKYPSGIFGVGENGMTFVPFIDVPNVVKTSLLWLDASDTSTITESSGAVSQWDNKGTLGNFSQASAALQPTTGSSTLNGLNVVTFAADYLTAIDTNEWKPLHDGTDLLIGFVWKKTSTTFGDIVGNRAANIANIGFQIASDTTYYNVISNGTANVVNATTGSATIAADTWYITTSILRPTNATIGLRGTLHVNAGTGVENNSATATASSSNPTYAMQIGAGGNNTYPLTGSIAEIVIASGANATETNRLIVLEYLKDKWAVY